MISAGLIRRNAATVLKGILPQSMVIAGVFCLFSLFGIFVGQMISILCPAFICTGVIFFLSALCNIFLSTPLALGIQRWVWRLTGGADDSLRTVFYAFGAGENYRRALCFSLHYNLRLYAVRLTFLPALFLNSKNLSEGLTFSAPDGVESFLSAGAALLQMAGMFLYLFLALRYFLAPYLLAGDDRLSPVEALRLSFKIMRKRVGRLLGFSLGFIGWILLCMLILPILYVLPLIWISSGIYARYLISDYNQSLAGVFLYA